MDVVDLMPMLKEGVSLTILLAVLFGVYRLTNRMVDVLSGNIERCCESLERIADALKERKHKVP